MDIFETIKARVSVRAYQDRPVEDAKLERMLEAARLAPSGSNRQAWKFIVVRDQATRTALANVTEQGFLAKAPVIIAAVCTEDRVMTCGIPAGPVDCAIALEHIALAATALGLGSCWIGRFDQDACKRLLAVPAGATIIEMMTIGYASDTGVRRTRKQLAEIVSYDKF